MGEQGQGIQMYHVSRSLYRELAPMLKGSAATQEGRADRRHLLDASEALLGRLLLEPDCCANPARSLFREVRHLFAVDVQLRVWSAVRAHVEAGRTVARQLEDSFRHECHAFTRQGSRCRREPRPGRRFCPSHARLEEEEIAEATEGAPALRV